MEIINQLKKYLKQATDEYTLSELNILLKSSGYFIMPEYPRTLYKEEDFKGFKLSCDNNNVISITKFSNSC